MVFGRSSAIVAFAAAVGCAGNGMVRSWELQAAPVETWASPLTEGDIIEIRVFREPDLAGLFQVANDGHISFPLIGQIHAKGRTPFELAQLMETRLGDGYLKHPQVTVLVKERQAGKVFVLGQVTRPGTLDFEPGMTVVQAISSAGGFSPSAASNSVRITRRHGGENQVLSAPIDDIRDDKIPNVVLAPGDLVFVPEALF